MQPSVLPARLTPAVFLPNRAKSRLNPPAQPRNALASSASICICPTLPIFPLRQFLQPLMLLIISRSPLPRFRIPSTIPQSSPDFFVFPPQNYAPWGFQKDLPKPTSRPRELLRIHRSESLHATDFGEQYTCRIQTLRPMHIGPSFSCVGWLSPSQHWGACFSAK